MLLDRGIHSTCKNKNKKRKIILKENNTDFKRPVGKWAEWGA